MIKIVSKQSDARTSQFPLQTVIKSPNTTKMPTSPIHLKYNSKKKRLSFSEGEKTPNSKLKALKLTLVHFGDRQDDKKNIQELSYQMKVGRSQKDIQLDDCLNQDGAENQMQQTRSIFTVSSNYICPGLDLMDTTRVFDRRAIIKLRHHGKRAASPINKLCFLQGEDLGQEQLKARFEV